MRHRCSEQDTRKQHLTSMTPSTIICTPTSTEMNSNPDGNLQHDDHTVDFTLLSIPSCAPQVDIDDATEDETLELHSFHTRFWARPYFQSYDFVELLCCIVVCAVLFAIFEAPILSPRQRPFPSQILTTGDVVLNLSLSEDLANETVSDALLVVIVIVLPLVLQFTLSKVLYMKGDGHATFCVYCVAMGMTHAMTNFVKHYVGYLRPCFYDMCEPDEASQECTGSQTNEARQSFPSGHASFSFCGMTLLSLYLLRRFGIFRVTRLIENENGEIHVVHQKPDRIRRVSSVLCVFPMIVAVFIAASRVVDNRHFPADVVCGALFGWSIASFSHGLWFSALPSRLS